MSLPAAWVDHLFAKLTTRYGVAFTRVYADADPAMVKADWGQVLAGIHPTAIAYALQHMHPDKPPNASQFRSLCVAMPAQDVPKLPEPKASPERVRQALARLAGPGKHPGLSLAAVCIDSIHGSPSAKEHGLSPVQRDMIASCSKVLGERDRDWLTAQGYAGFDREVA